MTHLIYGIMLYNPNKGQEEFTEEAFSDYWDDWYNEREDDYMNIVGASNITDAELGMLSPTHSKWRRMQQPLMGEVKSSYKGDLSKIGQTLGNLKSGRAARGRKNLLSDLRQDMLGVRGKVSGERGKYQGTLEQRIRNLFNAQ